MIKNWIIYVKHPLSDAYVNLLESATLKLALKAIDTIPLDWDCFIESFKTGNIYNRMGEKIR